MSKLIGVDKDIEISLKEYGFAWCESGNDYVFFYGVYHDSEYTRFDWCAFSKDLDVYKEFDWGMEEDFHSWYGLDISGDYKEEFMQIPLPLQIYALVQYYGNENIFGTSYSSRTYDEVIKDKGANQ